jgi:hypothetical protein
MVLGMPVTASADPAERFAILTVTDPYTFEEWRTGVLAAAAEVPFRNFRRMLIDRRRSVPPTTAFVDLMLRFAAEHAADAGGVRTAVVVADSTGFGMARMAELRSHGSIPEASIRVFREYDAAVDWLVADQA